MGLSNIALKQVFSAKSMLEAGVPRTLKGLAIGNGWIDARRQYPAYLDYGLKHGLVVPGSDVREITVPVYAPIFTRCPSTTKRRSLK